MPELPTWPRVMPNHHPRIAHLMPYLFGDSPHALIVAHRLGYRFIDRNGQRDRNNVVWIMHWADLRKGGYRWVFTGNHDAKGREIRARVPKGTKVHHCSTDYVGRLRTRKHGGRRPHTAAEDMAGCKARGLTMCLEGKGTVTTPGAFAYIANASARTGCPVIFMTLQSIGGWRTRLTLAHGVNLPLALLPRGPKPGDWPRFRAMGVRRWGRWRRR